MIEAAAPAGTITQAFSWLPPASEARRRHPDVYGAVFSGSPGAGYQPAGVLPDRIPRTYLVAGPLEPFFPGSAARWAAALRGAGADVVMSERVASHGDVLWRAEFPLMVAWAFGR